MSEPLLSENELKALIDLMQAYHRQAMICEQSHAYLPGCIMLGSCLETALLMIVGIYPEEALKTQTAQRSRLESVHLFKWTLDQLLDVAIEAGWLPA